MARTYATFLRGVAATAAVKTHCIRGHEFTPENTYVQQTGKRKGKRTCLQCRRDYGKVYYRQADIIRRRKEARPKLTQAWAERYWQRILDHFGHFCSCCGETIEEFLTLEHLKGDGNKHRRDKNCMARIYLDVIREGFPADKYAVLCIGCNWVKRRGGICPHQRSLLDLTKLIIS